MASCSRQPLILPWLWPGLLAAGILLSVVAMVLGVLWHYGSLAAFTDFWQDSYWQQVVIFTFQQALLSTVCSLLPAIPLARALARRRFLGRQWLLRLLSLTLVLPALVAIFGLITVYGRQGWLAQLSARVGLDYQWSIYGLKGVLLAHVFFNLPLATQLLLQTLESLPSEQYRLANQLGMSARHRFRWLEWPRLRWQLLFAGTLIFTLCFVSFTTVLVLGGGPQATTIELAIYQSLNDDLSLAQITPLALLQISCCLGMCYVGQRLSGSLPAITVGHALHGPPHLLDSRYQRFLDTFCILLVLLLLLLPLLAVVVNGCNSACYAALTQPALWRALWTSLSIGCLAAVLAVTLALSLLWSSCRLQQSQYRLWGYRLELTGSVIFAISPIVLATTLFLLFHTIESSWFTWALISVINGLITLPYALRILAEPMRDLVSHTERLCASLNIHGFNRLRLIEAPLLLRPLSLALAFTTVLSLGDVGVIALFGNDNINTLSRYLYQQISAYRSEEGAVTALLLLGCCLVLFVLLEQRPRYHVTT